MAKDNSNCPPAPSFMDNFFAAVKNFGFPRLVILVFVFLLLVTAFIYNLPMNQLVTSMINRLGMNLVMVLAMIPTIQSGTGPNFGLTFGIICGLIGATFSIEWGFVGLQWLGLACAIGIFLSLFAGTAYGMLMNKVKGQEMTIGTYAGFSIVSLMNIFWLMFPYKSTEMIWPYGGAGLRNTIVLNDSTQYTLNDLWLFNIGGREAVGDVAHTLFTYNNGWFHFGKLRLVNGQVMGDASAAMRIVGGIDIPTGLVLVCVAACVLLYYFQRTKTGLAMQTVGGNPRFAEASGLSVDKYRIIGSVVSCAMGAVGIILYSQSFGFLQLYDAPLYMGIYAVSAILIGGASLSRATITQAIVGTFLYQSLLVLSPPVANMLVSGDLSEVARIIVSNGIILYALTRKEAGGDAR